MSTLIKNGLLVTMDSRRRVFEADLRIDAEKITAISERIKPEPTDDIVDASGKFVIPGLIQVHSHLCQVLFRGLADDLELLDWLQEKIWPYEKAHNEASLRASARLGLLEMQLLGTTSVLDMGTTTGGEFLFQEAERSGMRYWGGNCFMDLKSASGPLYRKTDASVAEAEALIAKWHKKTPLLEYCVCPRFAISCTEKMLKESVRLQNKYSLLLHTHASENKGEVALIKKRTGRNNVDYLNDLGLLNRSAVIAHGIHLTEGEIKRMVSAEAGLAHCPSSNMKLASGFAPIPKYLKMGMKIGLGADGAPCNNTLDPFLEMRLASLIHKPKFGPRAMPAEEVFRLATLGGAEVLGRSSDLGSIEEGKLGDIVLVDRSNPSVATVENAYSALVYSCSGRDVTDVWIHGRRIVKSKEHQILPHTGTLALAKSELAQLLARSTLT
jgi:5-methylthioadenosine/S-adenosylhomocysteine deaminase